MPPRQRVLRHATVDSTHLIAPQLMRVTFDCPSLVGTDLAFTDHYIKFVFPPEGAGYEWPFDPEEVRAQHPEHPPVTRTYTIRNLDSDTGELVVDFVVHGAAGLAGPWSAHAVAGDTLGFFGPGGAWAPQLGYDHFVLGGDESAAPAICAALEALPVGTGATVLLEIADAEARFVVPTPPGVELLWVARNGAEHGVELSRAVRGLNLPAGRTSWFVHGNAAMIKELRRHLFVDLGVPRADVSISGYWRSGMPEEGWQSSKHEFVTQMESSELAAGAEPAQ